MTYQCPKCGSCRVEAKGRARRAICATGALVGAVGGAAGVVGGAEFGFMFGAVAGPPGMIVGGIAGAIIGALAGAATGGAAGATLGEIVDDNILDDYACLDCAFSFGKVPNECLEQPIVETYPASYTNASS